MTPRQFHLTIDMNVLNHLGIGLYSSTPAVVTEIIANAWDADATEVSITIDEAGGRIIVVDDGHGMSADDLQEKFLRVGYARREQTGGAYSPKFKRPVMGRKGIGKLAMFSLAQRIELWSHREHAEPVAASINVKELKKVIQNKGQSTYQLETPSTDHAWGGATGTRIVLTDLLIGVDRTERYLRPRLARRFSIIGEKSNFRVSLNGQEISPADRGYHGDLQLLWAFDAETRAELLKLAKHLARDANGEPLAASLDPFVDPTRPQLMLKGFIATVDRPKKLRALDANINQISLFSNGRVFQEDLLGELSNSQVFNSYVIGEVHADFLDRDEVDRSTASREAVKHADPLVVLVRERLSERLREIALQWDEWRRFLKPKIDDERMSQAIELWLESLGDPRDRTLATRLVRSIDESEPTNDEVKNVEIKRDLLRSTIVGFEKLRVRQQLDRLEEVTDVLSPQFQTLFLGIDDVEATHFHDITRTRLRIIEEFERAIVDAGALEKVAEQYLVKHLWLLDPTWDRIKGSERIEQTLTKELKAIAPDEETGARLDIVYRASAGRHVIVELKRPGKKYIDAFLLMRQGARYRGAMEQYLRSHPDFGQLNGSIPPIDVYFVVEEYPVATGEDAITLMMKSNMRPFTYRGLIANARNAYDEYLKRGEDISRIEDIVKAI